MIAREAHVYGFVHPLPADARAIVQFCCRTNCNSLPEELQFVAQRIEKRRATDFQLTGNVFSKLRLYFGKRWATDGNAQRTGAAIQSHAPGGSDKTG